MRDAGYGIQDMGYGMRDAGYETQDAGLWIACVVTIGNPRIPQRASRIPHHATRIPYPLPRYLRFMEENVKNILGLGLPTDPRWVNLAGRSLEDILTDNAYCEQKAATSCISLIHR